MINEINFTAGIKAFKNSTPFDHCVIEDFFENNIALDLERECPNFEDDLWHVYDNSLEIKKTTNLWCNFGPTTYRVLSYLNSPKFVQALSNHIGIPGLMPDIGLHGGGWHIHGKGGILNQHLDYSVHPKLGLQRKLNLIVYLNSKWEDEWGGQLGLWDSADGMPTQISREIIPSFNKAVLFDTTQNSWHGLVSPVAGPAGETRRSLAVYYMVRPPKDVDPRAKALFAPTESQKQNPEILDLIEKRADASHAHTTYIWPEE